MFFFGNKIFFAFRFLMKNHGKDVQFKNILYNIFVRFFKVKSKVKVLTTNFILGSKLCPPNHKLITILPKISGKYFVRISWALKLSEKRHGYVVKMFTKN